MEREEKHSDVTQQGSALARTLSCSRPFDSSFFIPHSSFYFDALSPSASQMLTSMTPQESQPTVP